MSKVWVRSVTASDLRLHFWLAKLLMNCLQQTAFGSTPLCAMWRKLQLPLLLQALVSRQANAATPPYIQIPQILLLVLTIVGSCQSLLPGLHRFVRMRASSELGSLTSRQWLRQRAPAEIKLRTGVGSSALSIWGKRTSISSCVPAICPFPTIRIAI